SRIKIYDGDTNSTSEIACWGSQGCYWNGNIDAISYSGIITIRFNTDSETPKSGFVLDFNAIKSKATNVNLNLINTNTTAILTWDGTTSSYWIVHTYGINGDERIYTTTTNTVTIDSL